MKWIICNECGERKPSHSRLLCKNCYDKLHPGARPMGFCLSPKCPRTGQYQQLWARGLCKTCYIREYKADNLDMYPKKKSGTPGVLSVPDDSANQVG